MDHFTYSKPHLTASFIFKLQNKYFLNQRFFTAGRDQNSEVDFIFIFGGFCKVLK